MVSIGVNRCDKNEFFMLKCQKHQGNIVKNNCKQLKFEAYFI